MPRPGVAPVERGQLQRVGRPLDLGTAGRRLAAGDAVEVDVEVGGREFDVRVAEQPPAGDHLAAAGHQHAAVVHATSRLVAEQVGVDVGRSERPRAFKHKPFANRLLAKRKMAGAGIEQNVGPAAGQSTARAFAHPGIAADLEPDANATDIEQQIANGIQPPVPLHLPDHAGRPLLEPAWFVVDTVGRQELLAHQAEQLAIDEERRRVVQARLVEHRHADCDDQPFGVRQQLAQFVECLALDADREEHVLAAVAGDGQFGQADQLSPGGTGFVDGRQQSPAVARPVHRRLVHTSSSDADVLHDG